ncbi:MAG TPA: hypothetical protein VG675_04380 [Bryobacteraceae bacterium]|nr:hypothetical protein [Bryobacteraceae bacterium]
MIRVLIVALIVVWPLAAQQMRNYAFHLGNGALVLYQTYSPVSMADSEKAFGTASASGNVIQRTLLDDNRRPWLAYELHIDRISGPGPVRFVLSLQPLGGWKFFQQKPVPREIANGDRVLMDVLEQPDTGRKIFDTFQVGIGVPMQIMPTAGTIPQVPHAGALIRVSGPQLHQGDTFTAVSREVATGTQITLTVPENGRFTFSSQPGPGFRMEAIAEGSLLRFLSGQYLFQVLCTEPVVEPAGAWYLWVKHEAAPLAKTGLPNIDLVIPSRAQ